MKKYLIVESKPLAPSPRVLYERIYKDTNLCPLHFKGKLKIQNRNKDYMEI